MRLEYYSQEKLKKEILAILEKHLDLTDYRVFFFGSRVAGKGTERSDIDVGVDGKSIPWSVWYEIREEIEAIPTLYTIDIVDFSTTTRRFRAVALTDSEDINIARYDKIPITV